MPDSDPTRLHIARREDLPAAIAYLHGYHPARGSIACLAVRDREVVFTMALDAGQMPDNDTALAAAVDRMAVLAAGQASATFVLAYGTSGQVTALAGTAIAALHARGVEVNDAVRIDAGRLFVRRHRRCRRLCSCPALRVPACSASWATSAQPTECLAT